MREEKDSLNMRKENARQPRLAGVSGDTHNVFVCQIEGGVPSD
ncbi:MAG: hypothetical protein AAF456_09585 [Planctomycetota bacterium]